MNSPAMDWVQMVFRWAHVVAGILWIGHLYFFNFVNAQLVKTYDADSKKKVVPELMPRALYWFRWGAAYTWITGFLLLGVVYYSSRQMMFGERTEMGPGAGVGIGLATLIVGFALYDSLWKRVFSRMEAVGVAISWLLLVAIGFGLDQVFEKRTVAIHLGALMGTIMAANVWMRIWPAQRKIIAGIKGTAPAPDASVAATAALRSKHNTYLSVPLVLLMLNMHAISLVSHEYSWLLIGIATLVGWGFVKALYSKSASASTASF